MTTRKDLEAQLRAYKQTCGSRADALRLLLADPNNPAARRTAQAQIENEFRSEMPSVSDGVLYRKLKSASNLARFLTTSDMIPVVSEDGLDEQEAKELATRTAAAIKTAIYAIVVELAVKTLWELERDGHQAPENHKVLSIFRQLSDIQQANVNSLYDEVVKNYEAASEGDPAPVRPTMYSLEEALVWNESAIKSIKYGTVPKLAESEKYCVPAGVIWDGEFTVLCAGYHRNFAAVLTEWTLGEKSLHGMGEPHSKPLAKIVINEFLNLGPKLIWSRSATAW